MPTTVSGDLGGGVTALVRVPQGGDPFDVPGDMAVMADDVLAAIKAKPDSVGPLVVYGPEKGAWDTYTTIAAVEPDWTRAVGGGFRIEGPPEPGLWHIEAHTYLDVTGGTSSAQGTLFGVAAGIRSDNNVVTPGIQSGTPPSRWLNGQQVTLGRLTVSAGERNVVDASAAGWIANVPGQRLDVRPMAQLLGSAVAGASAQFGLTRVTVTFYPGAVQGPAPVHY